jgi:hypothetical protein
VEKENEEKGNAGEPATSNEANEAEVRPAPGLTSFAQSWKNIEDNETLATAPETLDP